MTESAQQVEQDPVAELDGEPVARRHRPRLLPIGVMLLLTACFFALSLAQSMTRPWNSDTASVALQGWDMVHGQLLLHGWWASDVNFYTFDAPIYGLTALVLGLSGFSLHVAGALIYTLVFLSACWLARGGSEGAGVWLRVALVALFMTADLFGGGALLQTIMIVPDHNGTIVFVFVAYVVYTRFADRRWAPWAMLAVLMLGQLGDVTVRYVAVPALLVVWAVEHLRRRRLRTPETWLALAAIVSVPVAVELRSVMKALGAYYLTKAHTNIAPLSQAGWHFTGMWQSLFGMFGVDVYNFPGQTPSRVALTCVGGFALLCGLLSLFRALIRWTKVDDADRLLAVTVLVYLAAYEFSTVAQPGNGGGYEFVGVVVLLAVLSARAVSSLRPLRLPSFQRAGTALAASAAVICLVSGTSLFQTVMSDPVQPLAAWLEEHHLTYGLGGYWNASPITVYSGGGVQVRPIYLRSAGEGFIARTWGARQQWYDVKSNDARFVVAEQDPRGDMTEAQVESALGAPSAVYSVDGYSILVYSYNLLTKLSTPGLPAGA